MTDHSAYYQGVSYRWKVLQPKKSSIAYLAQELNLSQSVASILYNRGFTTKEAAYDFLFPSCRGGKYIGNNLRNGINAIERISKAIERGEKILIFGDYDVDGITSTALLFYTLKQLQAKVNFYLPNRITDGYGLSESIVERTKQGGYDLLITVDNGTNANDAIRKAFELKMDLIITDHHSPKEEDFLNEVCTVNPHHRECLYPFKGLCGVGVVFKLVEILYAKHGMKIPAKAYELFMLGTIADLVPVIDENRYLLQQFFSLKQLSPCMRFLKENAGITSDYLSSTDIAFSITPQLNALGRLDDPREAVFFLLSNDEEKLARVGKKLYMLNESRKRLEREHSQKIIKFLQSNKFEERNEPGIVACGPDIPAGIIGLIAARVTQTFWLPSCILHECDQHGKNDPLLKGSCRSIPECNIFTCLSSVPKEYVVAFGGHAGAAGVSIQKKNIDNFKKHFLYAIHDECAGKDTQKKMILDGVLCIEEINSQFWKNLLLLEPFGTNNPVPLFFIEKVRIKKVNLLKDTHVKCTIQSDHSDISVIFFNQPNLYTLFTNNINSLYHVAAKVVKNEWRKESKLELIGIDVVHLG